MNNDNLIARAVMTRYATFCGTLMGLFWLAKFTLIPLGFFMPMLMFIFLGLSICVPFIAYAMARNFRNRYRGGVMSFGEAWIFLFLTFLYASCLRHGKPCRPSPLHPLYSIPLTSNININPPDR